eukprot:Skav202018  [mRNA]  locus=scaffold1138:96080:99592:+ [translate_table: standard]
MARRLQRAWGLSLCLVACLWKFGGSGFLSVSSARSSSVALKASTGDDFDFGEAPPSRAPAPPAAAASKTTSSIYDDDDDDYDDDEIRRDEPVDSGSVATIVSFALLAVTAIGFLVFQVNQQNAAFSGSKDAPEIKKVKAVFDTYYAEDEKVQ